MKQTTFTSIYHIQLIFLAGFLNHPIVRSPSVIHPQLRPTKDVHIIEASTW